MKNEAAVFLLAIQFLTRLPVATDQLYTPERLAASTRYFPLVGVLIGALVAGVFLASVHLVPVSLSVLIALGAGLLLTGAFHEDGLADTFDGIGGGHSRARALEIMRDSRLGTYGTSALIMALALKAGALLLMTPDLVLVALVAGHGLSRLSSVIVIRTSRYVREEGTGKPVAAGLSMVGFIVATSTGAFILALWGIAQPMAAMAWAMGGLVLGHIAIRLFFEPKLGGYTGDTLGAVQQASEIGFYLGLVAWL